MFRQGLYREYNCIVGKSCVKSFVSPEGAVGRLIQTAPRGQKKKENTGTL